MAELAVALSASTASADGYSRYRVRVVAREADGSPSTRKVLIVPSHGRVDFADAMLVGGTTQVMWTSCSYLDAGCEGMAALRVYDADNPEVLLGESPEFQLARPLPVGDPTPCQGGGHALHIEYEGFPTRHFTAASGTWLGGFSEAGAGTRGRALSFLFMDGDSHYRVALDGRRLSSSLRVQVYPRATGSEEAAFLPVVDVSTPNYYCSEPSEARGAAQIRELRLDAKGDVERVLITFETRCKPRYGPVTGCIAFDLSAP